MERPKAVGRNAPALKYDLLTALLLLAAHDRGSAGRLAQRLALVITARFNWRSESFASGTAALAQLWGVTDRTAKRELAAMRALGWLTIRRAAARGRVTEYGLNLDRLIDTTRPHWAAVGPDYVARMGAGPKEAEAGATVVPFQSAAAGRAVAPEDGTLWAEISAQLQDHDAHLHAAWFAGLVQLDRGPTRLDLAAPSRFVAKYVTTHHAGLLLAAASACDARITHVRVLADL